MKFSIVSFAALLFCTLSHLSCKKDNGPAPGFDMQYQRDFDIPAGIGIFDVHHFQLQNIPSNWEQYLQQHGKTAADISGVIASEASLGGVFGDAQLDAIERISVRVYDVSKPNDFVEIAYRDPTPLDTGNILPLIPSLADARRFFSASRFSIDVVIYLRKTTQITNEVRLNLVMRATF